MKQALQVWAIIFGGTFILWFVGIPAFWLIQVWGNYWFAS